MKDRKNRKEPLNRHNPQQIAVFQLLSLFLLSFLATKARSGSFRTGTVSSSLSHNLQSWAFVYRPRFLDAVTKTWLFLRDLQEEHHQVGVLDSNRISVKREDDYK